MNTNAENTARFESVKNYIAFQATREAKKQGLKDVEDVIQHCFLYVWERLDGYKPEAGAVTTYAFWKIRGAVSEYVRVNRECNIPTVQVAEGFDKTETVDSTLAESVERVRELLSTLSGVYRRAVEMKLQGMTFAEMASAHGTTAEMWRQRYHTAVNTLRAANGVDPKDYTPFAFDASNPNLFGVK